MPLKNVEEMEKDEASRGVSSEELTQMSEARRHVSIMRKHPMAGVK